MTELGLDFLQELIDEEPPQEKSSIGRFPPPEQKGPLRFFEKEMSCNSRNCRSSTFMKLSGIPMCMMHCLRQMNEMLYDYELK